MICEDCNREVESVNDADQCDECYDAWFIKRAAYWHPLYQGERLAGVLTGGIYERDN